LSGNLTATFVVKICVRRSASQTSPNPPRPHWDVPFVTEQAAVEHAAQMADSWQRMYFRAIRSLRDWRRYTPQVTINNPNQVNIATDGGQQVNVADANENQTKKISK
jgi:hypothetical protein